MGWGDKTPRDSGKAKDNQADVRRRIEKAGLTEQTQKAAQEVVDKRKGNAGNN